MDAAKTATGAYEVVIEAAEPRSLVLHWAVDEWVAPSLEHAPPGTVKVTAAFIMSFAQTLLSKICLDLSHDSGMPSCMCKHHMHSLQTGVQMKQVSCTQWFVRQSTTSGG